jgi:lysophospholipase L1-like esterase
VALAVVSASVLAALAPTTPSTTWPIDVVYAGDSLTSWPGSWLDVMQNDDDRGLFNVIGGYAHSGWTTAEVAPYVPTATNADVLVMMLGTNDVNHQVPVSQSMTDLRALASKTGARHVVVIATPPNDITGGGNYGTDRRVGNYEFNRQLQIYAANRGWIYGDPWAQWRAIDNTWTAGATVDGIHPSTTINERVERVIGMYIEQAWRGSKDGTK